MRSYRFKVKPWAHQRKALFLSWDKPAFALSMEQGTGKTKVIIDTAGMLYHRGKIDALVIVAPQGVQRAWIRDELPKHMSDDVRWIGAWWKNKPGKKLQQQIDALYDHRFQGLRVLAFNYEIARTPQGKKALRDFVRLFKCLLVADESHYIKNPKAKQTSVLLGVADHAHYRRTMTGTPAQSPIDIYAQYLFLDEAILGFSSYVAFKAHHMVLEDPESGLSWHIYRKLKAKYGVERANRMRPQIQARDADGKPLFRNVDELHKTIAPYTFRVLKKDCLDLPPKVYEKRYVELTSQQRQLYEMIKEEFLAEYDKQIMAVPLAISRLLRMQQIVGGFFKASADVEAIAIEGGNPKLEEMLDVLRDGGGKTLIWARFKAELELIATRLEEEYGAKAVARYWGEQTSGTHDKNKKRFILDPACRFFVSQQRAGGIGLDGLQIADREVFFSNEYSLTVREQAEDRGHRGGSERHQSVTIIDIEAEDTLDRKVIETLRSKKDIADVITGDPPRNWL